MNFQNLSKVEIPDFYLDVAFGRASTAADKIKTKSSYKTLYRLKKSILVEQTRINTVMQVLTEHLIGILKSFPKIDEINEFYQELVKATIDYDLFKKSLGGVNWAVMQIKNLCRIYNFKIRKCRDLQVIGKFRNQLYGRVSSVVKQIKKELAFLEGARRTMKEFPSIKTSIPTIVIAGFPNVGKTTLLKALTGSEPKIASYPFTTQQLMIGYTKDKKFQIIDTPGLLDRPLKKRNKIELQAILALKHLAQKIIFVIDPTEICGYSLDEQIKLLLEIRTNFKTEIKLLVNKLDLLSADKIKDLKQRFKDAVFVSAYKESEINLL